MMNIVERLLDVGAGWMEIASKPHSREDDKEIAEALGWRVSKDPWWNVKADGSLSQPGDEWCVRRDGRFDIPCNEPLPIFTAEILDNERRLK
jgi:hypothetical protein